jgi:hypothetical protein
MRRQSALGSRRRWPYSFSGAMATEIPGDGETEREVMSS